MKTFDYFTAFSRSLGWITKDEMARLRGSRVAIAGLGGVGGSHLLTLTRLGVGRFTVADFDVFELVNFNRQTGASVSNLGKPKTATLTAMARDINPELDLRIIETGVDSGNVDDFLQDADIYVDGLDFFAVKARRCVFAACAAQRIPAVTAAPLGMGAAVVNFLPDNMTFEQYFGLEGCHEQEQLIRFLVGLSPRMLHRSYIVDRSTVDFLQHRGPSTPMACQICSGAAVTEVLKILLRRGPVLRAPWAQQFDAYRSRFVRTWRPGGYRNPLQRLAISATKAVLRKS